MDYNVDITVTEIRGKGECYHNHKVGDILHIGDGQLCPWAAAMILPFATALRFGGTMPWKEKDADTVELSCPDPDNLVIFKLTRKPKG
jgi:uncharacterized repeat protein (TIGR04076 family)